MNKTIIIAAFIFAIIGAASVGYSAGIFVRPPVTAQITSTPDSAGTVAAVQHVDTATSQGDAATAQKQPSTSSPGTKAPTGSTSASAAKPATSGGTPAPKPTPATQKSGLTVATVAEHGTASDCWIVISGKVYNMTSYIPVHPGGRKAITRECGGDGTAAFNGERVHSRPEVMEELAQFYVGDVTN